MKSSKPTLMLVGLGGLGSVLLELLARERDLGRIVVASRNIEKGTARCNLALLGALAQGLAPRIDFVPLDLNRPETVAQIVDRESPDLILSTATLQPWWLPDLLPPPQAGIIKSAGLGVWLPVHLTLTLKLMQALKLCGYGGITLTAPFPDVINCILGRLELAPTCGIGNIDEIVPKVQLLAAQRLGVPLDAVRVLMVAHHALEAVAFGGATTASDTPPYFVRIQHGGQDVTETVDAHKLLGAPFPVTPGPATHFLTAGSTLRLVRALFSERGALLHAPAPNGLPGGYPVIAGSGQVRPAPLDGLTLDQAITINERSHRFDGIESIQPDGTAVIHPPAAAVFKTAMGYDCQRLSPENCEERAKELITRFREYARNHGVDLPAG